MQKMSTHIERLFTRPDPRSKDRLVKSKIIAVDTETTGLDLYSPNVSTTHISWWDNEGNGDVYEVNNHRHISSIDRLMERIYDPETTVLMFNAKFDIEALIKAGRLITRPIVDVLLMAQINLPDEKSRGLKHLAKKYLNTRYEEADAMKKWMKENPGKVQGHAPRHVVVPYATADARYTLELFYYLSKGTDEIKGWTVLERELYLMQIVLKMERFGVKVDADKVKELAREAKAEVVTLKNTLIKHTGNAEFNPNSSKQVNNYLYTGLADPTRFSKKTGKPSASTLALLDIDTEFSRALIAYRKTSKAWTTYLSNFRKADKNGILRVSFNQGAARTGRFSSSGPNLQNIPRRSESTLGKLRGVITRRSPNSILVFVDYKQIEVRIAAHFHKEPHVLKAILSGEDIHSNTCKLIFEIEEDDPNWDSLRYLAKKLNFAILYGVGAGKFQDSVLLDTNGKHRITLQEAASYINAYKAKHPMVEKLFSDVAGEISRTGGVTNYYGRYMPVDRNKPYVGVNYLVQGTAADFLKLKMIQIDNYLQTQELKTRMIMTIHDEIAFEVPKEEYRSSVLGPLVLNVMQDKDTFDVPLLCSLKVGKNWLDQKEVPLQEYIPF